MACRITDFSETSSTADVLKGLSEVFQKAKSVPDEVQKILTTLNMIPEFKNQKSTQNKEVETVVYCFKLVVEGIFSLAQSYVTKCHKLADYICEEEPHTIKVINEGNVKEFKEFLDEVLSYSDSCQKTCKLKILCFLNKFISSLKLKLLLIWNFLLTISFTSSHYRKQRYLLLGIGTKYLIVYILIFMYLLLQCTTHLD